MSDCSYRLAFLPLTLILAYYEFSVRGKHKCQLQNKSPDELLSPVFQYKYQINIDGTVAAYRFPYLMAGDSLVLKQDSDYYEHFYKDLVPFTHYVPFKHDLSDLLEKIQWARDHDDEVGFFLHLLIWFNN